MAITKFGLRGTPGIPYGSFAGKAETVSPDCFVEGIGTITTELVFVGTLTGDDVVGVGTLTGDDVVGLGPLCK